jgi:nucleotide-binding universal stress UspA family protein
MKILFAYDGSESADGAIAAAAGLLAHGSNDAVVLTVWEPLTVQALRAERFASPLLGIPSDAAEVEEHDADQARLVAEHGARLAGEAGFEARPLWVADERKISETIVEGAAELDADLIVLGARGLTGIHAMLGSVSNRVAQHAGRPVLVIPAAAGRQVANGSRVPAAAEAPA